jgi:hypothetical protein
LALRDVTDLKLPEALPVLVDQVYGGRPQGLSPALERALADADAAFESETEELRRRAITTEIRAPDQRGWIGSHQGILLEEEENPAIHQALRAATRLTRPSVTIVCASRDADGRLLLLDGTRLEPELEPSRSVIRSCRLSSVAVQRWEWVQHFWKQAVPKGWSRTALLQDCRLAVFEAGIVDAGLSTQLQLSNELGLVVRPKGVDA